MWRCRLPPHTRFPFQERLVAQLQESCQRKASSCQPWVLQLQKAHVLTLSRHPSQVAMLNDGGREECKGSDAAADGGQSERPRELQSPLEGQRRLLFRSAASHTDFSLDPILLPSPSLHRGSSTCTYWTGPRTVSENPAGGTGKGPVLMRKSHISLLQEENIIHVC